VELRYWSDVLMLKADYTHVPEKAPIPSPENYPQEVKKWLQPTISVQSDDDRIIAEAKQIMEKVGNPDAVAFIREMLNRITKIKFEKPKGCDAVSMLEQGGACTSHANLGAALCRVVGIPARVIACYPTWNIPFQTHYIIEAYIDGFGWIPAETSMNQFPFQSYKQVYVSKVQIEDEKDSFDAFRLAAPGVPRWSLNEMDARLATWNNKEKPLGQPYCDHIASPLTQFSDDSNLIEAFHKAKELWEKYLKAKTGTESYPGLVKSLEAGLEEIPTSPKDLIKALQQTLKE